MDVGDLIPRGYTQVSPLFRWDELVILEQLFRAAAVEEQLHNWFA
jgi:hypothetical protein